MGSRGRVAVLSAAVAGFAAIAAPAIAQTVPMPIPAPHSRGIAPRAAIEPAPAARTPTAPPLPAPRIVNQGSVAQASGAPAPPAAVPGRPPAGTVAKPGGVTAFDGSQRALVERANAYLTSVSTLVGNFVQVGPDGNRT